MRKVVITLGKVLDKFMEKYAYALKWGYVRKPISWALYQTWKWVDENEKERQTDVQESN